MACAGAVMHKQYRYHLHCQLSQKSRKQESNKEATRLAIYFLNTLTVAWNIFWDAPAVLKQTYPESPGQNIRTEKEQVLELVKISLGR